LAGFQMSLIGRFWMSPEVERQPRRAGGIWARVNEVEPAAGDHRNAGFRAPRIGQWRGRSTNTGAQPSSLSSEPVSRTLCSMMRLAVNRKRASCLSFSFRSSRATVIL
jgi:hypothetical protein